MDSWVPPGITKLHPPTHPNQAKLSLYPGADKAKIEEAAAAAKAGCPISKVLKLEIVLELTVAT